MAEDRKFADKTTLGAALVVLGVLFLLGGMGLGGVVGRFVWAALFAGAAFYVYTEGKRKNNHKLEILALPLAGIALASLLSGFGGGALFFAAVGLAFAFVWRRDPNQWWAVIVAGALGSSALAAALPRAFGGAGGTLFLLGLAATFYALTRLRVKPQAWGIYPAAGLALVAVLGLSSGSAGWLLPLLLIGGGLFVLFRQGRLGKFGPRPVAPAAPEVPVAAPPVTPVAPVGPVAPVAPVPPVAPVDAAPTAPRVHSEGLNENAPDSGYSTEGGAPMPDPDKGPS